MGILWILSVYSFLQDMVLRNFFEKSEDFFLNDIEIF